MPATSPVYALPYPVPTDPADVPTDMQNLATRLDAAISLQPCARVSHNATQAVAAGATQAVAFNSETIDLAFGAASTQHDTATNNSRLTCRYAGVYDIRASICPSASPGSMITQLRQNGSSTIAVASPNSNDIITGVGYLVEISTLFALAVGDYVEVVVNPTNAISLGTFLPWNPVFSWVRVG